MKVLAINPMETPRTVEINNTLEDLQRMVGGLIEEVCPWEDAVAIVCNEEGKLLGLPANRILRDDEGIPCDLIVGPFILCGIDDEKGEFTDIPENLIEKYTALFKWPEIIF